ncbi:ABC transporter permease [Shimazuella sp. AN120528]|uniref:ABC transporter permease n=1 Tax=Shimazuella soli TaxID=1892854 RepID=UPI001F1002B7|nr:ABC transporter permease [Shimazuella soli]MCH5584661.1 ABC transporter permease [Shimazuella soli]
MIKFVRLIQNENMKMFSRVSNWVMVGFFFLVILFNVAMTPADLPNASVEDQFSYFLSGSDSPLLVITALSIIWASSIMAAEFSSGTIKLLLIRPVTRVKILWSKYTLVVLYALGLTIIYFLLTLLFAYILYPGVSFPNESITIFAKMSGLSFIESLFMITLTYFLAVTSYNRSLALGVSLFLYLMSSVLAFVLQTKPWSKYLFFTQLNLTKYASFDGGISAMNTLSFSLCVLGVYFILFIVATWITFASRDVAS